MASKYIHHSIYFHTNNGRKSARKLIPQVQ